MSRIVEQAEGILDAYWNRKIPVDVDYIADCLGVRVEKSEGIDGDWNISGKFSLDSVTSQPVCTINSCDTEQRQRFTLAHELAHYYLGHGDQIDRTENLYRNSDKYLPHLEREANQFAAEILMPRLAVNYMISHEKVFDIPELARAFDVSEIAMYYRLKNLGFI